MNGYNSKKEPYKGIWVFMSMLVFPPVFLYIIFVTALNRSFVINWFSIDDYSAICLGFGTGFIYQMTVLMTGALKEDFKALVTRIKNFSENRQVSLKFARRMYKDDLKEDGIEIWIYLSIIIMTFIFFAIGLYGVIMTL